MSRRRLGGLGPRSRRVPAEHGASPAPESRKRGFGPLRLVLLGAAVVGAVGFGAIIGFALILNIVVGLTLTDQEGALTFPEEITVDANILNPLDVILAGDIHASVPFKQNLRLPLQGRYRTELELTTPVDVKLDVVFDGIIPVDTEAVITARADFDFERARTFRNIEFEARMPMNLQLPVTLRAPVDETIDFRYSGEAFVTLDSIVDAPIDMTIDAVLAVDERVSAPLRANIGMQMRMPREPQRVVINHADLRLALNTLRLQKKDDDEGPQRMDTLWGPADPALRPDSAAAAARKKLRNEE